MEKQTSKVWNYFKKDPKNNDLAQCSFCPKILSCKGSSTSGLVKHLDKVHKLKVSKLDTENSTVQSSSSPHSFATESDSVHIGNESASHAKRPRCDQQNIRSFFQPTRKISEIVARLAVQDGISVRAITRSEFIREAFKQKQLDLPKSEGKVMELILEYYEERKSIMKSELQMLVKSGERLSATLDEWTSLKNRRYLNVNLHATDGRVFDLGLVYIPGKCGATEVKDMVEKHLNEFDLRFENHIVATTSDGASVMKKFGRESPSEFLLCINHAVHLAVTDVIYKKQVSQEITENEDDSDEDDTIFDNEEYGISFQVADNEVELRPTIRPDLIHVLNEVRKIVKMFRKSPLKNTLLQEFIKKDMGQEMQLLLDVKTRWNSLVTMVERFLTLKSSIKKALADMNYNWDWNEQNEEVLQNLVQILNPVKLAVEALSRKDATILTCDAIISVLLTAIRRIRTPLSDELYSALEKRIIERRDVRLFSLCKYLHNPGTFTSHDLPNTSKTSIIAYAENIFTRLFSDSNNVHDTDSGEEDNRTLQELSDTSFEMQLNEAIHHATRLVPATSDATSCIKLKKEFQIYEVSKKRTPNLDLLYKALLTVKPTSTESERVFSIAGSFVTKTRNRLSDRSLNAMVFLKACLSGKTS